MNLAYVAPLQRAWDRAVRMLFKPFNLELWLTLGFASFLADPFPGGHNHSLSLHHDPARREMLRRALERVGEFFSSPVHVALAATAGTLILVALILCAWVTSRGRFIFLDNVAHERTGIVEEWTKFAKIGNSLFLWRVGFWIVIGVVFCAVTIPFLGALGFHAWLEPAQFPFASLIAIPIFLMILIPLGLIAAFVGLLFQDFVEPIMYRHDVKVGEAWGRLVPLLRDHFGSFLLYALFVLLLTVVVAAATVAVSLMTCCLGFLVFALPYVASVVLLPVAVTLRALGPEFLAQFGADFAALQAPRPAAPPATPGAGA
jgi:hypothetical protein